jgi:aldehyde:ferredoxin oxidoreductase
MDISQVKLLRINLSNNTISEKHVPAEKIRLFLGGKALGFDLAFN